MLGLDDIGSLAGGLLSFFGGERRNDAQLQQAREANAFSAQQFATRYQTTTKDMQAAGLNPMLAYSQGGGSPPSGQQAVMQDTVTPAVERYNQTAINSAQVANIKADTFKKEADAENVKADTVLKRAQTYLAGAQEQHYGATADQARQNINLIDSQARKIAEEIRNIPKEGARLDALVANLHQEFNLIKEKTGTQEQATHQMRMLALKTMLESDLLNFDVKAAQDLGNMGRYSKEGKVVLDVLRMMRGK